MNRLAIGTMGLAALMTGCGQGNASARPEVTEVTPAWGPASGATQVTFRGSALDKVTSVLLGDTVLPVLESTPETISVRTPHGVVGAYGWSLRVDAEPMPTERPIDFTFAYDFGAGTATFIDATASRTPMETWRTQDAAVGDIDGDGDIDVILPGYFQTQDRLLRNDGSRLVDDTEASLPSDLSDDVHAELGDLDGDGDLDLYMAAEGPDRILINDGTGRFTDETAARMPEDVDMSEGADFGDIDGDGDLDIVVANLGTGEPNRLLRNRGDGTFEVASGPALLDVADPSYTAELVDIDGDGDLDMVVGNYGAPSRVLLNDGSGAFAELAGAIPGPEGLTTALMPGDVDGDGDLDLIDARFMGEDRLLLNDGKGAFTEAAGAIPSLPNNSYDAQFADLDGDQDLDLVIATSDGPNVLLTNDGSGTFARSSELPDDRDSTYCVEVADFDADGALDLLFTSWGGDGTALYLNDRPLDAQRVRAERISPAAGPTTGGTTLSVRGGGFVEGTTVELGGQLLDQVKVLHPTLLTGIAPPGTAGLVNAIVSVPGSDAIIVEAAYEYLAPPGDGPFVDATDGNLPLDGGGASSVVKLVDLDADGALDIILGRSDGPSLLYRGSGKGAFEDESATRFSDAPAEAEAFATADLDGDGDIDIVAAGALGVALLLNDGVGVFSRMAWPGDALVNATAVAVGDLGNDGDLDVLIGHADAPESILVNVAGTYEISELATDPGPTAMVKLSDFDGDGNLDALLVRFSATDQLLLGTPDGGFVSGPALPDDATLQSYAAAVGDVDLDGDPDIIVGIGGATSRNRLWLNSGGTFSDETDARLPAVIFGTSDITLADMDGDGDEDLIEFNWWGPDWVYRNTGEGAFEPWTALPELVDISATAGAVGDVDGDGDLDIVVACAGDRTQLFLAQ